jgi:hypothetical protein
MKFEQVGPEFRPVTITLEAQEEVDVLYALLGAASGSYANDLTWKLYSAMGHLSDARHQSYWTGSLLVKKDF